MIDLLKKLKCCENPNIEVTHQSDHVTMVECKNCGAFLCDVYEYAQKEMK